MNLPPFSLVNLGITKSTVCITCGSLCIVWTYAVHVIIVLITMTKINKSFCHIDRG